MRRSPFWPLVPQASSRAWSSQGWLNAARKSVASSRTPRMRVGGADSRAQAPQADTLSAAHGHPRRAAFHRARASAQHDRPRVLRLTCLRDSSSQQDRTRVVDTWREYHDHLGTQFAEGAGPVWNTRFDELFTNLLFAIAQDVRFKFDRVQLKKGVYSVRHRPYAASSPTSNAAAGD